MSRTGAAADFSDARYDLQRHILQRIKLSDNGFRSLIQHGYLDMQHLVER